MKSYLLAVVCFVLSALILSSCTNPSKIHQRAVNRGYEHKEKVVTVKVTDTIKVNGKDSVIFRDVEALCPEYEAQPKRYEVRYAYKTKRDTLRLVKYQTKWRVKENVKIERIKDKVSFWQKLRYLLIGAIVGWIARIIYKTVY